MTRAGKEVELSPKEFALLDLFMRHADEVLSRTTILEHVWDFAYDGTSNVVDVYVRYLREKIDRPFDRTTLETVRGVGYRLRSRRVRLTSPDPARPADARVRARDRSAVPARRRARRLPISQCAARGARRRARPPAFQNLERDLATSGDQSVEPTLPDSEAFAQIVDVDGQVVNAAPRALLERRVLTKGELADARTRRITIERGAAPGDQQSRLLAGPAGQRGLGLVVVVGTSLDEAIDAQHRLELALVIGLPLLAAIVSVAGWFLAGAALKPVRDLVEEADEISAVAARGQRRRLSVPETGEELADLARHLNELLARIEAALEHERAFLDDASHDLRTPISIVRSELELARMQTEAGSELARALDSSLEEVDRLDRLAVNLLVLARSRSAGPPRLEPVELGALSRRAAQTVARSRDGAAVPVQVNGSADVRGRRGRHRAGRPQPRRERGAPRRRACRRGGIERRRPGRR